MSQPDPSPWEPFPEQWGADVVEALLHRVEPGRPALPEAIVVESASAGRDHDGTPVLLVVYRHPFYDDVVLGLRRRLVHPRRLRDTGARAPAAVLADRIVEWELSAPLSRNCTRLVRDRAGVCWWGDGYPSGHAWIPLSLPSRQLDPGRPCTTCGTRSLVALGPEDEPRFLCAGCLLQEGRMRHDGAPPLGRTRRHEPGQWDFHPVDRLARMAVLATLEPPFTCAWCGVTDDLAGLFLYDDAAWWVCRSCWTPKPDDGLAGVLARL